MPLHEKLQLTRDEMRQLGYRVVDQIVEYYQTVAEKPVMHLSPRTELEPRLREPIPEQPADIYSLLDQLQRDVWSNIGNIIHPRFFAFIPSPSNFVSVMADALSSGYNPFAANWLEGSGPAQIELVTIDWLRQMCGLPETAGGLLVSGGSMANLTALVAARSVRFGTHHPNAIVYFSDQTHSSLEKALRILGFSRDQVRKLPSDDQFRLQMPELKQAVEQDRAAGREPFCVIANAGTTNTGAIDPLNDLADFCSEENLWLHIDGAYGAAACLSERGKKLMAGIERADSLSLDPHKWLFQPFEIGCVILRDARMLKKTFHTMAEYLEDTKRAEEEEINFYDYGPQLTRGFRALKLWLSLKTFGAAAFRQAIEHGFELAEFAESVLRQSARPDAKFPGCWEIVSPAAMGIITFRFVPPDASSEGEINEINRRIVEAQIKDGFAFANSTALRGRVVQRLCTINPRTTEDDVRGTIEKLEQLGREATIQLKKAMNEVRVKLNLKEGFRSHITAGKHIIVADEPESAGGTDVGPSPYDLLLSALGACTAMTLKLYIERKNLPITDVEVMLTFDRIHIDDCESCSDEEKEGKKEIQHISRLIYVTGDVTAEQKERLLYIAGRCPVHVTLHSNPHVEDFIIVRSNE